MPVIPDGIMETLKPVQFICEPVEVHFHQEPVLEKKTGCPYQFTWRGMTYSINEVLAEWHEYERRGRMARNMRPEHAARAQHRGSWGVGLDYYRVNTDQGRIFDLYFDRAPKDVDHRKGGWFLYQELAE